MKLTFVSVENFYASVQFIKIVSQLRIERFNRLNIPVKNLIPTKIYKCTKKLLNFF